MLIFHHHKSKVQFSTQSKTDGQFREYLLSSLVPSFYFTLKQIMIYLMSNLRATAEHHPVLSTSRFLPQKTMFHASPSKTPSSALKGGPEPQA